MSLPRIACLLLAVTPCVWAAETRSAPEIPLLKTWGDLLSAKPLLANVPVVFTKIDEKNKDEPAGDNRMTVRVGIDRDSARPGEGALLYCLVETRQPERFFFPQDDGLGPFAVRVENPFKEIAAPQAAASAYADEKKGTRWLFMKVVPLPADGTYGIALRNRKGDAVVARAAVKVGGERGAPWYPWGEPRSETAPAGAAGDRTVRYPVANPRGGAALPWDNGSHGQRVPETVDDDAPLPQLLSDKPDGFADAQAMKNGLRVKLTRGYCFFGEYIQDICLARWWLNGKILILPEKFEPEARMRALAEQPGIIDRMELAIQFDPARFGAKEGDEIGVQLLFTPYGWRSLGPWDASMLTVESDDWTGAPIALPELSRLANRVDFVYRGGNLIPAKSPGAGEPLNSSR